VIGGALGIVGGHGVAYVGASMLAGRAGPVGNLFVVGALEPIVFGGVVALGALAGLLPAVLADRTQGAGNLAPLSLGLAAFRSARDARGARSRGVQSASTRRRDSAADVCPAGRFDQGKLRRDPDDQVLQRQGSRDPWLHHSRRTARPF